MKKPRREQIRVRLGDGVMILAIARGQKYPIVKGWEKLGLPSMADPAYLATLDTDCNLGISLGPVSGGLIALDFDSDSDAATFLACNPGLENSFTTRGARGCQIWVRIRGDIPASCNLKDFHGRKVCEVRAAGRQSVVWGTHPDGHAYRWLVDAPPAELAFGDIQWPPDWLLPWKPAEDELALLADQRLIEEHGQPFTRSEKGKLTLNSMYFVARFARPGDVLFEPSEGRFYTYHSVTGLWRQHTEAALKIEMAEDLKEYASALPAADSTQIINARTERALAGYVGLLQGQVEERDAFQREPGVVHVANGMLQVNSGPPWLRPFDAGYRSRNRAPVPYDPAADCPRFRSELLESALSSDDVFLAQRYFGACVLGGNPAQKILVLTGTAGGGKSTLLEILERILGRENVAEIRTEHLCERFEIARYIGKTLLTGKDVPGRFLEAQGAHKLKALVGHDLLDAERKNSNTGLQVVGNFGVVITCNSRLRVRLDGDADAWRRRLLIVKYERPKPERPERDFADRLLSEEGPGILRWLIDGAGAHLAELADGGEYALTPRQQQRITALLAESDSVREFVRQRVEVRKGSNVSVFELVEAYMAFCDDMGWEPRSARQVENALADAMQELRRVAKRNDIPRDGGMRKGFAGVQLVEAVEAASV